eukprot:747293-Hanusia_phi.AAC.1
MLLFLFSIVHAGLEATQLPARHPRDAMLDVRGGKPRLKKWKRTNKKSKEEKNRRRTGKVQVNIHDQLPPKVRVFVHEDLVADRSREEVLSGLCSRQTCNALDPSLYDFEGAGLERQKYSSLEDYIEWTKQKKSSDEEVGITEFATATPGVGGLLKARWFDFRVNEMRLEEETPVLLTDATSLPHRPWPLRDELDNQEAGFFALKPHFGKDVARRVFVFASALFKNFTAGETSPEERPTCAVNIGGRDHTAAEKVFSRYFPFLKVSFASPNQAMQGARNLMMSANVTWFKQRARASAACGGIAKVEEKKYLRYVALYSTALHPFFHLGVSVPSSSPSLSPSPSRFSLSRFTVSFVLAKSGWDTTTLVNKIAFYLKVNPRSFSFAGLKDKSGVTEQEIRSHGIAPSRLLNLNDGRMKGMLLGNFKYVTSPLRFGQHGGNRFNILLRHLRPGSGPLMLNRTMGKIVKGAASPPRLPSSPRRLVSTSTPFSLHSCPPAPLYPPAIFPPFLSQSFASFPRSPATVFFHLRPRQPLLPLPERFVSAASMMPSITVGKLLSKGDWENAVSETLRPPALSCSPNERKAKLMYSRDKDVDEALRLMPGYCHDERMLLQAIKDGKSPKDAALSMPHARLFKFAYWSRVWNLLASERARRMSMRHAVEGDIVLVRKDRNSTEAIHTSHFSSYTKVREDEGVREEVGCGVSM